MVTEDGFSHRRLFKLKTTSKTVFAERLVLLPIKARASAEPENTGVGNCKKKFICSLLSVNLGLERQVSVSCGATLDVFPD